MSEARRGIDLCTCGHLRYANVHMNKNLADFHEFMPNPQPPPPLPPPPGTDPRMKVTKFSEALGRTIRLHREVHGFSLEDMARHQGMTSSGWSRVETGDTEVRASHLFLAAQLLRIPISEIVKEAEAVIYFSERIS